MAAIRLGSSSIISLTSDGHSQNVGEVAVATKPAEMSSLPQSLSGSFQNFEDPHQ